MKHSDFRDSGTGKLGTELFKIDVPEGYEFDKIKLG
ncbi:unnamed protein product, partial [marine sediment metagenome]